MTTTTTRHFLAGQSDLCSLVAKLEELISRLDRLIDIVDAKQRFAAARELNADCEATARKIFTGAYMFLPTYIRILATEVVAGVVLQAKEIEGHNKKANTRPSQKIQTAHSNLAAMRTAADDCGNQVIRYANNGFYEFKLAADAARTAKNKPTNNNGCAVYISVANATQAWMNLDPDLNLDTLGEPMKTLTGNPANSRGGITAETAQRIAEQSDAAAAVCEKIQKEAEKKKFVK